MTVKKPEPISFSPRGGGFMPVQIAASALSNTVPYAIPTLSRRLAGQISVEISKRQALELLDYDDNPKNPARALVSK